MTLLEVKELHFAYPGGVRALNGVDLSIAAGESVAVIGRNGSGKTTLVKHFNGLLQATAGSVLLNGEPTAGKEPAELAPVVGLVFQNPDDQIFSTRVWDEVAFGPHNLGLSGDETSARVEQALAMVGLRAAKDVHPYDLTITERKLLCLASILAMRPAVVVLDEPTTAQDQLGVRQLGAIIGNLLADGHTVVSITHDMDFVAECFARTVVMRQGQVILDGATEEVFAQPELLLTTYVRPPAMAQLAHRVGAPRSAITVPRMRDWVVSHTSSRHPSEG